jgi:hypothetical protein
MNIQTQFDLNQRVSFFSVDYQKEMKGVIVEIHAAVNVGRNDIDYIIHADETIKSSNQHHITEDAIIMAI